MTRKHKLDNQKPISDVSKEPSGAQKRKKQKEIEDKDKKLRKQAERFFKSPTQPHSDISVTDSPATTSTSLQICVDDVRSDGSQFLATSEVEMDADDDAAISLFDPSSWPQILNEENRNRILQSVPNFESTFTFVPVNGHKFSGRYFTGSKKNGESYFRDWLRFSKISNSAFCLPCCFFSSKSGNKSPWSNWGVGNIGFQDFKHAKRGVEDHEDSLSHFDATRTWKCFLKNVKDPTSLTGTCVKTYDENINHWRLVLRGIVDAVLFLAKNNLAFQGGSQKITDPNCGNFLNLIKLLSKYYAPLAAHVDRLQKNSPSYLSAISQNEFILLCGQRIRTKLVNDIKERKYFSILFDSTPDSSRQDQISQVIRTVECKEMGCRVVESFIDFITTTNKTGLGLSKVIQEKLEMDGLDLMDCRGQGYDNGANMAGIYSGVQARILEINDKAKFLPCAAHSLNLVGVNAAEKVPPAKLILGDVQNIYLFFSGSTSRWDVLQSKVKLTLKYQSNTRWSSKTAAVSALYDQYPEIVDALTEISTSESFTSDVNANALSRLRDMLNYKFLLGITIWNQILFQINICNLNLQDKTIDVSIAKKKLNVLKTWLENFKETGFQSSEVLAQQIAENMGIEMSSGFENIRQGRGINPRYMDRSDALVAQKQTNYERFEADFFDKLMEKLISEISRRFDAFKKCTETFEFLWGRNLKEMEIQEKQKCMQDLCHEYPSDFSGPTFLNEVQSLETTISAFNETGRDLAQLGPMDVLNILYANGLASAYPNCETALRIFLTLPVSVASNERSFSKMKTVKNYLRSTMGQERLNALALISIGREVADDIDFDEVINDFASQKCRKIKIV
ncbi:Zinc finger MYM-type protein 1 [Folsomia candida]|uniref:Zinc finger MYM-type protein 1 n=2 Tax=Folsomia candida TaxID=158441 RepID=A0A226DTI0_FOLCA|nr:Zinc finger MYM-type protein 1 [Folsomia candida]